MAPTLAAALLLVLAGAPKLVNPHDTRRALRSVGFPVPAIAVRAGGLVEVGIGTLAVLHGGRVADGLVAASYLGFTGFVIVALRSGGVIASCGCVGRPDTPPTLAHVLVTAAFTVLTGVAAAVGSTGVLTWTTSSMSTVHQVAVLGFAVLIAWLAWLALAELPRLRAIERFVA
jgi:uncharacterized protein YjeT (DUF2065 family)